MNIPNTGVKSIPKIIHFNDNNIEFMGEQNLNVSNHSCDLISYIIKQYGESTNDSN